MTGKAYHHGNLRPALLDAARRLLRTEGAAGLSLRSVARAAGVSHTAPYRHFADKQALLAALAETGFARLRDGLRAAAARFPGDPRRQLVEAAAVYVRLATEDPELTHLMFGGVLPDDAADEDQRQTAREAYQGLVAIIEQGVRDGVFVQHPPLELAATAWSLVHGLAMLLTTGRLGTTAATRAKPETLARRMAEHLIAGIAR
jgi:AcrR family transcriptional regulator